MTKCDKSQTKDPLNEQTDFTSSENWSACWWLGHKQLIKGNFDYFQLTRWVWATNTRPRPVRWGWSHRHHWLWAWQCCFYCFEFLFKICYSEYISVRTDYLKWRLLSFQSSLLTPSAVSHMTPALQVIAVSQESPECNGTTSRKQETKICFTFVWMKPLKCSSVKCSVTEGQAEES